MSVLLIAIVVAIGAGAVIAVSTREPRAAAIGLVVALVASAFLSDPLPTPAILGVRVVAGLLAAACIQWAGRRAPRAYSPFGWPAESLLAAAGAIAGVGLAIGIAAASVSGGPPGVGGGGPSAGPAGDATVLVTASALTCAGGGLLLALGMAPMIHGARGIRRAIGLVLVTQAVLLIRIGIGGPSTELEEVARAVLLVVAAGTGAILARAAETAADPEDVAA